MAKLTLRQANRIIDQTMAKGREMNCRPLSVAVVDEGGNLVAFKRADAQPPLRFAIAFGKAYGAVGMGVSSRRLGEMAVDRPHFVGGLVGASGGQLVPVAGGLLIKSKKGEVMGAVGVTGDSSDNDEAAGRAGIEAANLTTD